MSKGSFLRGRGGRRGRSADVNVINPVYRRSATRRAKIAFLVTLFAGWFFSAVVADQFVSGRLVAVGIGLVVALAAAFVVGLVVLVWPVVRIVWHWLAEITAGVVLAGAVSLVGRVVPGLGALLLVGAAVGGLFVFPPLRHRITALVWCVVCRHRLRVCFAEFLPVDRAGSIPFILAARPTPVGERVWVWLRPGLSYQEFSDVRLAKMAVSCWASSVQVAPGGSGRFAAFLQFDVKRRNSFDDLIPSPLAERISSFLDWIPGRSRSVSAAMADGDITALDLTDVPPEAVTVTPAPKPAPGPVDKPGRKNAPAATGAGDSDDLSDYI